MRQVVWFKRDLRIQDHAPLSAAALAGPVVALVVFEPEYWQQADRSPRHHRAWRQAVASLEADLSTLQLPLVKRYGDMLQVLERLLAECGPFALHSHQETDSDWTYQRDRAVADWCRMHAVDWSQPRQFGVVRGLRQRDGWARQWEVLMAEPVQRPPRLQPAATLASDAWPDPDDDEHSPQQPADRTAALRRLQTFLSRDSLHYRGGMSAPGSGATACSRLSVPLTWGTLSLREVVQAGRERRASLDPQDPTERRWRASLSSFDKRLHWHCHFIQKLETAPSIEHSEMHPVYRGLRDNPDAAHLQAWTQGETGWPFVDACMRSLAATGWLNFRMRAMLMCVASYHLWLPWQVTGRHLARLFTDYEAGIHWPQVQMQSGTTGINTYRIYNPVKQGLDHDPRGQFIRRWVPELAALDDALLHQPWTASSAQLKQAGVVLGRDYPAPILDPAQALRSARDRLRGLRSGPAFRAEAQRLQEQLGSRASGLSAKRRSARRKAAPASSRTPPTAQLGLFPDGH